MRAYQRPGAVEIVELTEGESPDEPPTTVTKIKTGILKYLFEHVWKIDPRRDHSHSDVANWIDEPANQGRIRTHCRLCGGFVGYRPEGLNKRKAKTASDR